MEQKRQSEKQHEFASVLSVEEKELQDLFDKKIVTNDKLQQEVLKAKLQESKKILENQKVAAAQVFTKVTDTVDSFINKNKGLNYAELLTLKAMLNGLDGLRKTETETSKKNDNLQDELLLLK